MTDLDTASFVDRLVKQFPFLQKTLEDHLDQNDELLPHVLFGDITRLLLRMHSEAVAERRGFKHLEDVLAFLDRTFSDGGDKVQELLSVSFLENLPVRRHNGADLQDLLGPALKAELTRIRLWRPPSS